MFNRYWRLSAACHGRCARAGRCAGIRVFLAGDYCPAMVFRREKFVAETNSCRIGAVEVVFDTTAIGPSTTVSETGRQISPPEPGTPPSICLRTRSLNHPDAHPCDRVLR